MTQFDHIIYKLKQLCLNNYCVEHGIYSMSTVSCGNYRTLAFDQMKIH